MSQELSHLSGYDALASADEPADEAEAAVQAQLASDQLEENDEEYERQPLVPTAVERGDAPTGGDDDSSGGCACSSSAPGPSGVLWLMPLLGFIVRRRARLG